MIIMIIVLYKMWIWKKDGTLKQEKNIKYENHENIYVNEWKIYKMYILDVVKGLYINFPKLAQVEMLNIYSFRIVKGVIWIIKKEWV